MKKYNEEIDLLTFLLKLYYKKKFILKTLIIVFIFSLFYSLSLENIYKASSSFYPHYQNQNNSSILSDIAGLAGLNNQELSQNVPTTLPQALVFLSCLNEILNENIKIGNKEMTLREYLMQKQSNNLFIKTFNFIIKLPYKILEFVKLILIKNEEKEVNSVKQNYSYIILDKKEYALQNALKNKLELSVNNKDGLINLSFKDKSPNIAADIAQKSQDILQNNIIRYKLKNIKSLFDFSVKQLNNTKITFYNLQDSLANFKDSNMNIKSDIFKNKLDRLESEYNLVRSLYNELSLNKEKWRVQKILQYLLL